MNQTEAKRRVRSVLKEWDIYSEVLTTPIVYHPGGWEDTVPAELKTQVLQQRMDKAVNGGWNEATDAEVLCYLMTASMVQPLGSDWTQIFLYEGSLFIPQIKEVIPDTPAELSEDQKRELRSLKHKIRDSQIRRRKSKKKEDDMSNRKIVMEERDQKVLVGMLQEGCDPIIKTVEGDLYAALEQVNGMLASAQEQWAANPKNPTYTPPKAEKKPAAEAAAPTAEPQKAEDLPLLSGTAPEQPAETQEEKPSEAPAETAAEPVATEPEKEPVAEAPAEAPKPGEVEYFLQDGRGPFDSVQAAMDAMGLDKATRPQHNRYDRLSAKMKEQIQRRPKS